MSIKYAPAVAFALLAFIWVHPAVAQESRADAIAQQQAAKAATARPYEPTKGERIFLAVKEEFIDTPSGFYPLVGSVYSGGGAAFGAGFRQYYGRRTFWDLKGLWSVRNYKWAEFSTDSQGHAQDRLDLNAHLGWRDATKVAFYGIGMATSPDIRTDFRLKQTYVGGDVKARPINWVVLGAGLDYEDYNVDERAAPALILNPTYLHSIGSAGIDWRPAAGYARRGGLYELRFHDYSDRDDTYDFRRLEAEVVQHVPLLRENWVISMRGLINTILSDTDNPPFFLLPSLGSADTLRGYSSWRFRDRNSLLLQGEFRWIPNRYGMDMAIFYDTGKVTDTRDELNLKGLKSDVGAEVRFHGPATTPLRLGIARGSEGWHFVFGGSAAF